jgi:hypothetical protein
MRAFPLIALAVVVFAALTSVVLMLGLPFRTLFWIPLLAIVAVGAIGIGAQIRLALHRRDERGQW